MNKTLFSMFFCFVNLVSFSQTKSDTLLITEIVNLQMKFTDATFKRDFVLGKSSMPYDTAKVYYRLDDEFNRVLCGKYMDWSYLDIHSKFGSVETDSTGSEYSCFISTPIFNADKTQCRIIVSTHYSEWGGSGGYYYYRKRGKKWKLVNSNLIWVS